jgi:hypothetical protein
MTLFTKQVAMVEGLQGPKQEVKPSTRHLRQLVLQVPRSRRDSSSSSDAAANVAASGGRRPEVVVGSEEALLSPAADPRTAGRENSSRISTTPMWNDTPAIMLSLCVFVVCVCGSADADAEGKGLYIYSRSALHHVLVACDHGLCM